MHLFQKPTSITTCLCCEHYIKCQAKFHEQLNAIHIQYSRGKVHTAISYASISTTVLKVENSTNISYLRPIKSFQKIWTKLYVYNFFSQVSFKNNLFLVFKRIS